MIKKILAIIWVLGILFLTGCYDNREIDTLGNVLAIGVEEGSHGARLYTFAIGNVGGDGSESSGDGASLVCYSAEGKDISDAVDRVDRRISKKLSFAHTSQILFSSEIASEDVYGEALFLDKDYKVRPQLAMSVINHSPRDYLTRITPQLEPNADMYFQRIFTSSDVYVSNMRLMDFLNAYRCGFTVIAPVISVYSDKDKITEEDTGVTGSVLFCRGKSVKNVGDNPFMGLFYSRNKVKYRGNTLESLRRPVVKLDLKKGITSIEIAIKADRDFDVAKAEDEAEKFLTELSREGIDAVNTLYFARKEFIFAKNYESLNHNELIKNMKFNVTIIKEDE